MGWKKTGDAPSWAENTNPSEPSLGLSRGGFPYSTPGSHQSGFEGERGRGAEGASGANASRTQNNTTTEGSDPGDDGAQIEGYLLGLI